MRQAIVNTATCEELFLLALEGSDAQSLYKKAQEMVNSFAFYAPEAAKIILASPRAKENMWPIALRFIKYWGEEAEEWRIDDRNMAAHTKCKAMTQLQAFKTLYDINYSYVKNAQRGEMADAFVESTKEMHKTLLQSFTSLIFHLIDEGLIDNAKPYDLSNQMRELFGPDWCRLPLI